MQALDSFSETAPMYHFFADECRETSPSYAALSELVAADSELLTLIEELPKHKRQPNLIFASAKYLDAPMVEPSVFKEWMIAHWVDVQRLALQRATQTNEVGRLGVLLPVLAAIEGPLALLELGSSAGLGLFPDHYSYNMNGTELHPSNGPSTVTIATTFEGPVPIPQRLPEITWRGGIDLNPLDVSAQDDADWLRALIWPEQQERLARFNSAASIVRTQGYQSFRGDFLELLPTALASIPSGVTPVVFHSAAVVYLDSADRQKFRETITSLSDHWIAFEGQSVIPDIQVPKLQQPRTDFLLSYNGEPLAFAKPHGGFGRWLRGATLA